MIYQPVDEHEKIIKCSFVKKQVVNSNKLFLNNYIKVLLLHQVTLSVVLYYEL